MAVGGDFLGGAQPNGSSVWPQQMLVDYVRVYERDASPPPVVFRNGSFEEQGGSLADWSTFGNVLPNVQTHHEAPALDGSETPKIFGQFNGGQNFSGVSQEISVNPGDQVTASANALVRALDDLVGSNQVEMKFDYYSSFGGVFGQGDYISSTSLIIANAATANDVWNLHNLTDFAPGGAVEARLSFVFNQQANAGGAIHIDDVSLTNLDLGFNADADNDGDVDGADFLTWQRGFGQNDGTSVADGDFDYDGVVGADDRAVWEDQFGSSTVIEATAAVPEPSTLLLMPVGGCLAMSARSIARPGCGAC